ncbi:MAG TPA: hypothetical protein VN207_13000 [Ktedonobacteraceae bacterium]|nr:hypothetical protein [Ktedonobacteraceae bacterium]
MSRHIVPIPLALVHKPMDGNSARATDVRNVVADVPSRFVVPERACEAG